jgi:acyl-CoA thioester hydrolase
MKTFCRLYYQIPFSETDAMGIVHHSNHARYLERGRIEFLRLAGLGYTEVMKRGQHYPVLELKVAFKKPLVFDQIILVETTISEMQKVRLNFSYRIFPASELAPSSLSQEPFPGNPSVVGETFHCCVNNEGRPVEADPQFYQRMLELLGGL